MKLQTQVGIASWTQVVITESTPRLAASGGSMPVLPCLPAQCDTAIINGPALSHATSHSILPATQRGTVVPSFPQDTATAGVQRGVVISSTRTTSHSPLRMQRASYCSGLQQAAAAEGLLTPRAGTPHRSATPIQSQRTQMPHRSATPIQSQRSGTPLQRVSSQSAGRFYAPNSSTSIPVALSLSGPSQVQTPRLLAGSHSVRTLSTSNSHAALGYMAAPSFEPPVPMVLGAAADKEASELREELQ
jgi:hypothetical protein